MFYSHNLLARKGPLGTVWCAAHLQNKLKKSNYITVNIPSTVEQIMNPQVPIALRMSGHLLLGVVRIYSKKVEYLQHDYNVLRIDISKAYANADINLPEDANQAKFESITLPDNFALDLMDIDDSNPNRSPDSHLRPNEDISFADHSPASFFKNRDQTPAGYIVISIGEDTSHNPSISGDNSGPGLMPVEESSHPHTPPPTIDGVQDPDPNPNSNYQIGFNDSVINEDNVPPIEPFRIINSNLHKSPPISSALPDMVEPDADLINEILKGNNNDSSSLNEIVVNSGPLSPHKQTPPQEITHSEPEHEPVQDYSGPHASFGLAPSPPLVEPAPVAELPRVKQRRVKQKRMKYDEATVLTNEFMKESIDDASDLKRKRKGVSSFLGVWKLHNAHKKEKLLFDPVITGLCDNLSEMLEDGYLSSKSHLINTEEADPDAMQIERPVDFVDPSDINMIPMNSPDNMSFSSPHLDENTPVISTDVGSKSYQAQTTVGTGVGPTPDPTSSIGSIVSDMETPFSQSHQGFDSSGGLFDIPEVDDAEELAFIEEDDDTPGLKCTPNEDYSSGQRRPPPESGSLLPRTRAVAQYIKEKSAATPSTSENLGSVSMKNILQGKTRKVCSRMFFETLVLKSRDLLEVKQDEPYGDITLKVTPKLSKLQFSN